MPPPSPAACDTYWAPAAGPFLFQARRQNAIPGVLAAPFRIGRNHLAADAIGQPEHFIPVSINADGRAPLLPSRELRRGPARPRQSSAGPWRSPEAIAGNIQGTVVISGHDRPCLPRLAASGFPARTWHTSDRSRARNAPVPRIDDLDCQVPPGVPRLSGPDSSRRTISDPDLSARHSPLPGIRAAPSGVQAEAAITGRVRVVLLVLACSGVVARQAVPASG